MTHSLDCPVCRGERWVCENHPDQPADGRCCNGAGMPCPRCNVTAPGMRPALPPGFVVTRDVDESEH